MLAQGSYPVYLVKSALSFGMALGTTLKEVWPFK